MQKKHITFYSIIPPSILAFGFFALWGSVLVGIIYLSLSFLFNAFLAFVALTVALFITDNKAVYSLKQILIKAAIITCIVDIYSFIASFALFHRGDFYSNPFLSSSFSPYTYNIITQVIIPVLITLVVTYLLLDRKRLRLAIVVVAFFALLTAPWVPLSGINSDTPKSRIGSRISRDDLDSIKNGITYSYHGTYLEQILSISTKYKTLVIDTTITVPREGNYEIIPRLTRPSFTNYRTLEEGFAIGEGFYINGEYPYDFYINNIHMVGTSILKLEEGANHVQFQIPYTYMRGKQEFLNLKANNAENTVFGPYKFDFALTTFRSAQVSSTINFGSEPHQTPSFTSSEFSL